MKAALRDADMMQIKKSVEDAMATAIAGALDRFPLAKEIDSLRAGSGVEPLEEEGADGGGVDVAGPDLLEKDQQLLKLFQQHQQAIVDATALPTEQLKGELGAIDSQLEEITKTLGHHTDMLAIITSKITALDTKVSAGTGHMLAIITGKIKALDTKVSAGAGALGPSVDVADCMKLLLQQTALRNSTVVVPSITHEAKVHLDAIFTALLSVDHDELIENGSDEYEQLKVKNRRRLEKGVAGLVLCVKGGARSVDPFRLASSFFFSERWTSMCLLEGA